MPLSILAKKRYDYYHAVFVYKERRRRMRIKYNYKWGSTKSNPEYNKAVEKIDKRILYWNRRIKEIDKARESVKKLHNAIADFTGHRLRFYGNGKRCYGTVKVSKAIYYKYGLENGLQPVHLRQYINDKRESHPREYRKWATKMIVNDTIMREKWESFKEYMKNI